VANETIYFDYAATTPLDADVLQAMLPYFNESYGNPSSVHRAGQRADAAVEQSRLTVSNLLNAQPNEITFTSGATESNNLAIRGLAHRRKVETGANRLVTTPVEHPSVLETCRQLEAQDGFTLDLIPVDADGRVQLDQLGKYLTEDTAMVSVVYANNEIGSINPIQAIGAACRAQGIPFHTDAAQAANHLNLNVEELNVDLMTLGAHKFYGPKGIGALYHHLPGIMIIGQTGGRQEYGTRAGTQNVPSIVGFARSFQLARDSLPEMTPRIAALRDGIIDSTLDNVADVRLTGHREHRLANHASFAFKHVDGNQLLAALDIEGFACSSGSACKTGNPEPSPILVALGFTPEWTLGGLRVTLGRGSTSEHVDQFNQTLPGVIDRLRSVHSLVA
jgi:cysteine desulfurase